MSQPPKGAKDIFLAALDAEPVERAAFLDVACGGDPGMRRQVEALLRVHDEPDSLLDSPRIDLGLSSDAASVRGLTTHQPVAERPGQTIGRYKLLQEIGEGGFGAVYMAEQQEPVRRQVALKIIKLGMDTNQVIARFEAERQALALMDHPNIAKVLDAGATDSGRPYFVMELVRGIAITDYCDANRLTTKELVVPRSGGGPDCDGALGGSRKGQAPVARGMGVGRYALRRCIPTRQRSRALPVRRATPPNGSHRRGIASI